MRIFAIFLLISLIITMSGCFLPVEEELLPPDLLKPEEVNFRTIEVERGSIQNILEDNVVTTSSVIYELSFSNRSGYLAELNAALGRIVSEGEVLARLDTGSLEIDIIRQQIEVEKRTLTLEEIRRSGGSRFARRHAELDLELAVLSLDQMEDELAKTTILSPIDGEIVFINLDYRIGGFVPGRSVIFSIADPTRLHFEYTGSHVNRIRHGMAAEILIDSVAYPATVTMTPASAPVEDRDRYRNTIIFSVNNPDDLPDNLRRGSRLKFSIFIEEKHDTVIIPAGAMSTFMGQNFVQILEDGMRIERDIVTGIVTSTQVEVLSGLNEGDLLIIGIER